MENVDQSLAFARFYFGESAGISPGGISARLLAWGRAFQAWVEQHNHTNKIQVAACHRAWRRLARQWRKMPWEITPQDIAEHMRWMQQQGYKKNTINNEVKLISALYNWCAARGVDELCGPGFNPARGVPRPRQKGFEGTRMWSRAEIKQLLVLVGRDENVLGKREKAFFLLRLNSGVALNKLLSLRWEQIEQRGEDAYVRWSDRFEPTRLPAEVWAAIKDYLVASGRLEGMQPGKLIFASRYRGLIQGMTAKAEDWIEDRPMLSGAMVRNLRAYGRRLGIAQEKLNMNALRRAALRLRLDAGESIAGMGPFTDRQQPPRLIQYELSKLPQLASDSGAIPQEVTPPNRNPNRLKGKERFKHGMSSHKPDMQAVSEVMQEGLTTLDEEINCLRTLMQGLVELEASEGVTLEAYTTAIGRLGELVTFGRKVKTNEELEYDDWIKSWDGMHARNSRFPNGEQLIAAANQAHQGVNIQREAAILRVILRNVYHCAETCQSPREYVYLVNMYGKGCIRLMRLLDRKKDEMVLVQRYAQEMLNQAIRELHKEWGLDEIWSDY